MAATDMAAAARLRQCPTCLRWFMTTAQRDAHAGKAHALETYTPDPSLITRPADVRRWFDWLAEHDGLTHPDDSAWLDCRQVVALGFRAQCDADPCPGHPQITGEPFESWGESDARAFDAAMDAACRAVANVYGYSIRAGERAYAARYGADALARAKGSDR